MRHPDESSTLGAQPRLYGGLGGLSKQRLNLDGDKAKAVFAGPRHRVKVLPVIQSVLVPWLIFCGISATVCSRWRFSQPVVCWSVVGGGLLLVLLLGGVSFASSKRRVESVKAGEQLKPPSWLLFLSLTALTAWVFGVILGDLNFSTFFQPYYDYTNLNTHAHVDPSKARGEELMDAGRIQFTSDAVLDVTRSMGFRNLDTYCVAPITTRSGAGIRAPLASYDFWAVGLNCCAGGPGDFKCGDFDKPVAQQGLRLLRDDQQPLFRLAIQQAEATHSIQANQPLLFHWTTNATATMESYRNDGYWYLYVGMVAHFAWQAVCVGLAVAGFLKLGHM